MRRPPTLKKRVLKWLFWGKEGAVFSLIIMFRKKTELPEKREFSANRVLFLTFFPMQKGTKIAPFYWLAQKMVPLYSVAPNLLHIKMWHQNRAQKGPVLRTGKRLHWGPFWCHLFLEWIVCSIIWGVVIFRIMSTLVHKFYLVCIFIGCKKYLNIFN